MIALLLINGIEFLRSEINCAVVHVHKGCLHRLPPAVRGVHHICFWLLISKHDVCRCFARERRQASSRHMDGSFVTFSGHSWPIPRLALAFFPSQSLRLGDLASTPLTPLQMLETGGRLFPTCCRVDSLLISVLKSSVSMTVTGVSVCCRIALRAFTLSWYVVYYTVFDAIVAEYVDQETEGLPREWLDLAGGPWNLEMYRYRFIEKLSLLQFSPIFKLPYYRRTSQK